MRPSLPAATIVPAAPAGKVETSLVDQRPRDSGAARRTDRTGGRTRSRTRSRLERRRRPSVRCGLRRSSPCFSTAGKRRDHEGFRGCGPVASRRSSNEEAEGDGGSPAGAVDLLRGKVAARALQDSRSGGSGHRRIGSGREGGALR